MQRISQNNQTEKYIADKSIYNFPIHIEEGFLSLQPVDKMLAHWHDDIEILQVLSGCMISRVGGCDTELGAGDIIYINSRQFHLNHTESANCNYRIIQINPKIFMFSIARNSSVERLFRDMGFRFFVFGAKSQENNEISGLIDLIITEYREKREFYELDMMSLICMILRKICKNYQPSEGVSVSLSDSDMEIQREMITFIYEHFSEKITLEQIAYSGHISRSKCCKLFLEYLSQSPINFLTDYRLKESCRLLSETNKPLSEVAQICGFSEQSYYNRKFKQRYGCTPRSYRKAAKGIGDVKMKSGIPVSH